MEELQREQKELQAAHLQRIKELEAGGVGGGFWAVAGLGAREDSSPLWGRHSC